MLYLVYKAEVGSQEFRFDVIAFVAFELFLLKRTGAENEYSETQKSAAKVFFDEVSEEDNKKLVNNIIAGLPGAEEGYTL